jgi:dihydrolipoamide dehydrogenase
MYDVVVIGSGPGGYVAAIRAAQLGLKTACIEKDPTLGGTCLNVGCIPSKALLSSSELYYKMKNDAHLHGIKIDQIRCELSEMMNRKTQVVSGFTKGIEGLFKKNKVDWIKGKARLKSEHQIDVQDQVVEAKYIILATGSEPIPLPFMPFDEKRILSSTGALALKEVPKKLLIIGAGVVGVELGSVYSRLGSKVEILEFLDRICPAFDMALSKGLQKSLTNQGMTFHLSQKVIKADIGKQVVLTLESGSQMEGDAVLVAVGRRPYSQDLGLETLGIKKDPKGFVQIDGSFRTSVPHIFAIGDLVEGPMLAHKASEEGTAVAELIAGHRPSIDYIAIPNVAYTHPEVASVGFTEEELKKKGIVYKAAQFPFKANSRARCTGDDEGFVKILAETSTKKLLGVHILGPNASELIGEATVAIAARMRADELASTCHAHPTLSEAIKEAAMSLFGSPIHL